MADLDGDGHNDLITGCYEGNAYWLKGLGKGAFAEAALVTNADGEPLRAGQYYDTKWQAMDKDLGLSATPVDWDGDGDLDLLLGTSEGRMHLSRNLGSPTAPKWSAALEVVQSGGKELLLEGRHCLPVVADWDGDGLWDLVTGSYAGGAYWYRNTGKAGAPQFAAVQELVAPTDSKAKDKADRPGTRSQVAVADWDGDGRLDLLLGDCHMQPPAEQGGKYEFHGYVWLYRRTPLPGGDAAPGKQ